MKSAKITDYFSKKTPSAPIVDNTAPKEKAENSVYLDDMASVLLSRHPNRDHPFFAKRLKQQPKSNDSNFRVRNKLKRNVHLGMAFENYPLEIGRYFLDQRIAALSFQKRSPGNFRHCPHYTALDLGRLLPSLLVPNFELKRTGNKKAYEEAMQAILDQIAPPSKQIESGNNDDDYDDDDFVFQEPCQKHHIIIGKRPIVYVFGSSGTGKSRLGIEIAQTLNVPLMEINSAVLVRNGKPFEDILSGSSVQRSLMSRFSRGDFSGTIPAPYQKNRRIKTVVLVDEVDLVFPMDKFYTALNDFLSRVPSSFLCILTANVDAHAMNPFIDLPTGALIHKVKLHSEDTSIIEAKTSSLEEAMKRSDLLACLLTDLHEWTLYSKGDPSIPVTCSSYDLQTIFPLESLLDISPPTLHGHMPIRDTLLCDLHRNGHFLYCKSSTDWAIDYREVWRVLELATLESNQMKSRRTSRKIRPRPYLSGIPHCLLKRLQQPFFKS